MGSIDIPTFLRDKSKQSQTTEIEGNVIDVPDFLKKKEAEPTHLTSSATPSQSPSKGIIIPPPIIPKGEGINEPVSTQVVQPKITASYNDYIMHHEQRDAKREESKQKAVDKAAKNILKTKGIIKPGDENKALDVHQFAELSNEKSRLEESLKNKDALITYKDGEPELIEKGEPNVGGYIWNKVTDAVGGMSNAAGDLVFQLMSKIPAIRGDATEEETMKLYREEMSPTIRTGVTKLLGSDVPKEREKDYNGQFLTSAVGSIASMIPPIASPKGVGFILQAFDGGLQSINNSEAGKNLPESQKTIFATGVGIATGLLMKVGVDKIFGKQTDKIASGLTANVMADLVKNSSKPITAEAFEVSMQTAVKNLKNKVIAAGGKIGESAIAGGLFGTAMEATTIAAEEITNKATGQQVFEPTTWGEKFGRVLHAGSEMATVGGILGGIHIPFSKTRDYIKEKVGEAKTPEDIQALKDELISKVQEKVGGEESAQQINDLVDKYVEVYNKIPPEANNKAEIVDNIQERDDLAKTIDEKTQQLQVVDPAFHEPILQEINAANGRVDEINKEIANKAQEPQKQEEQPQPEVIEPSTEVKSEVLSSEEVKNLMNRQHEINVEMRKERENLIEKYGTDYAEKVKSDPNYENIKARSDALFAENEKINLALEKFNNDNEALKGGFTEGTDLNKMFADLKSKYGDKKGSALYDVANRLVNPNKNTIVEIRSNGVVVKEGDKYILKPFGNTDANSKKWGLYKGLDVTDQFQKSEPQPSTVKSEEVRLSEIESKPFGERTESENNEYDRIKEKIIEENYDTHAKNGWDNKQYKKDQIDKFNALFSEQAEQHAKGREQKVPKIKSVSIEKLGKRKFWNVKFENGESYMIDSNTSMGNPYSAMMDAWISEYHKLNKSEGLWESLKSRAKISSIEAANFNPLKPENKPVQQKIEPPIKEGEAKQQPVNEVDDRHDTPINIDEIGEGFVLHRGSKTDTPNGFNSLDKSGGIGYAGKDGKVTSSVIKKGAKILKLVKGDTENYTENEADINEFYKIIGEKERLKGSEWVKGEALSDITTRLWGNKSAIEKLRKAGIDIVIGETIDGPDAFIINEKAVTKKLESKPKQNEKAEAAKVPITKEKASPTTESVGKVEQPTEEGESKVPEFEKLKKKIPVAQTIDGTNAHEVTTTKEIATILGVSTAKAFQIMEKLEKEGLAYKYGYRTKGGWEDVSNSGLKSHSLGWELNSKSETKPAPTEKVKAAELTEEGKKDLGTKARELADKIESGEKSVLPSWMKAKLPPGTKYSGIDIDKAYANALRTFADIHDATKNFAKAIEEGFKHIKEWFKENNIDIDEAEMKANFENEVREKEAKRVEESEDRFRDKGILNRLHDSENIPDYIKKAFEEKGLKYKPETQKEAEIIGKAIVEKYGIEDAVVLAESNRFKGGVNSAIFGEALNRLYDAEQKAKTPEEKLNAAKLNAEISIRMDEWARGSGQDISYIQHFYKKSPLAIKLKEETKRRENFTEFAKKKEQSWKEFFDEMTKDPEFEKEFQTKVQEELKKERAEARKKRIDKVDKIFDDAINALRSGGATYSTFIPIPPKALASALEGMKKAYHAGEKVAKIIEDAISYITDEVGSGWDKEKFRKEWDERLGEHEGKAEIPADKREKMLERFRKKLKGLSENEKDEVIRKSFKKLVENGALEYEDFRKIIADTLGYGEMTPEQAKKIVSLVEDINKVDELATKLRESDRTERALKEFEIAEKKAEKSATELGKLVFNKPNIRQRLLSIMQLNTLTFASLVNNPIFNIINQAAVRLPRSIIMSGIDFGIREVGKVFGKDIPMQNNVFAAQKEFYKKLAVGTKQSFQQFRTGLTNKDYFQKEVYTSQIHPVTSMKELWAFGQGKLKLNKEQVADKVLQATFGVSAEGTARILNIGDKPQRFASEGGQAATFAKNLGVQNIDYKLFMKFPKEEAYRAFKKQGLSDEVAMKKAEEVEQRIIKEGEESVFQEDNLLNDMINGAFEAAKKRGNFAYGFGQVVKTLNMPFLKIPLNAFWNVYNLVNPEVALLQSAIYAGKALKTRSALDIQQSKKWFAHAVTGMAWMGVTGALAKAGVVNPGNPDEATKKERQGEQNYEQQGSINMGKLQAYIEGKDPNSVKDGLLVDLKWLGAMGIMMGYQAHKLEKMTPEQKQNGVTLMEDLTMNLSESALDFADKGVFANSGSMVTALTKGDGIDSYLLNLINMGTNVVQPATFAQLSRAQLPYYSKIKADSFSKELRNSLLTRSSVLRSLNNEYPPSKVSIWGGTMDKKDNTIMRLFNISRSDDDNFAQPIYNDYKKTNDTRFFPPSVKPEIKVGETTIKLNAKEAEELEIFVGQSRKQLVAPYINDMAKFEGDEKRYSELSNDSKIAKLDILYDTGYESGKYKFLLVHPEYKPKELTPIEQDKKEDIKDANEELREAAKTKMKLNQ